MLLLTIACVIILEGINTAIEAVVDLASPGLHPLAKTAKDVSAGVVLIAAIASGICVVVGAWRLRRRSRISGYRWFMRAVLISIFVYEVFAFYYAQFAALSSLAIDLLLYTALSYMIGRERVEAEVARHAAAGAVAAPAA